MTDLQLGLLVIGALAVAGVLVYNRVQERGVRREAEQAFGSRHADVLVEEPAPRRAVQPAGATPEARADYIIELDFPGNAPAALAESWSALERRFAHRAMLAGSGGKYQAALQMVSRGGVVGEAELLEFRSLVETLAAKLGASVSAPEMRPALEAAAELDRICADADIQVAFHVLGIGDASIDGTHPFQVTRRENGITLLLDFARTPDTARSYEAMARAGRQLAAAHGGRLVDDNDKDLDERTLAAIGEQLEAVRAILAARGIEPGSALALRLFS